MILCLECLGKKHFPVSGRPGCENMKACACFFILLTHLNESSAGNIEGFSFIRCVEGPEDLLLIVHKHELCGCTSGVNSKIGVHLLSRHRLFPVHEWFRMTFFKRLPFLF